MHVRVHKHTHTHIHAYTYTRAHAYTHTRVHTDTGAYRHGMHAGYSDMRIHKYAQSAGIHVGAQAWFRASASEEELSFLRLLDRVQDRLAATEAELRPP